MRVPKLRKNGDGRAFAVWPKSGGKRKYFGRYGTKEAETAYREWLARIVVDASPANVDPCSLELHRACFMYLEWAETYYTSRERTNSFENTSRSIVLLGEWCPENTTAAKFGPRMLCDWREWLIERGLARTTINTHVGRIKKMFRWLQSREYIPRGHAFDLDSVDGLRYGKSRAKETEPVEPVAWEHVEALLPFVPPPVAGLAQVQYWCGMRPGEACRMRAIDIDTTGDVWLYRPEKHKNTHRGKSLVKAVPAVAQRIIEQFRTTRLEDYIFRPADSVQWSHRAKGNRTTKVYPSETKRLQRNPKKPPKHVADRYSTNSYGTAIARGIVKANEAGASVPHWHPNQLRHSITTQISRRFGQQAAQRWLGHARLDTTAIYDEITVEELVEIAGKVDQIAV